MPLIRHRKQQPRVGGYEQPYKAQAFRRIAAPRIARSHDTQLLRSYTPLASKQLQTRLNAALHCKDQAAISEMVEQEQWGAEGAAPPESLSLH